MKKKDLSHIPEPDFVYDPTSDKPSTPPRNSMTSTSPLFTAPEITPSKPPKKKRRWLKIGLGIIVLAIIALVAYFFTHATKISSNPFSFGKLKGEAEGRINILLIGIGDPGHAGETLADTNMVVSINTRTNQVAMISLPRDTRVKIPGFGYNKINQAHADGFSSRGDQGGIDLTKQTVENTLDLPVHYYVRANFTGLKQVVDAVGGVDINVKEALYDPEYPCDKNQYRSCGFKLKAGQQHMDGATALKYARCRKGSCGDDFGRALRQQEVLQAVRSKALSVSTLTNPGKINALMTAASDNIKTDLSINNITRLIDMSKKIDQSKTMNIVFSTEPNGFLKQSGNSSDLLPVDGTYAAIQEFVKNIFTVGPIWVEKPTVVIENGTTTTGLGAKFSKQLSTDSPFITITSVTNALTRDYTVSKIIDHTAGQKPHTAAYLESLLHVKPAPPEKAVKYPPADFEIIIGNDYASSLSSPSPTPENN